MTHVLSFAVVVLAYAAFAALLVVCAWALFTPEGRCATVWHAYKALRLMRRRGRGLPAPVPRPGGYAVAGEVWPEYVPPEPMTHSEAAQVALYRRTMATDPTWTRRMMGLYAMRPDLQALVRAAGR